MKAAIVTGASSGLGREFALRLARLSCVDEVWLVARRRDRLDELAAQLGKPCRILELDLSEKASIQSIATAIDDTGAEISYLVNAAGFARFGTYDGVSIADGDAMIDLNCRAAVDLCVVCLPHMSRWGHILNIASCAGFMPLPGLNIYAATKAFMVSYTRSLRWEIATRRVIATAVCPYWMKTEFIKVGLETGTDRASTVRHFPLAQRPGGVAAWSLLMNRMGIAVATCSIPSFFLRIVGKFVPHCVTILGWEGLRRI